ncbi:MAG: NUDIX domain-containing protein [Defluviitaleaceae bacterium]|nr:NUDIX domain-containing protein [Defluviitaleaceae bacterium]
MVEMWDVLDKNRQKTGALHRRGQPLQDGEYHLVVNVWIINDAGEFLIARRTENKPYPLMWEAVGGSAVAGDDSQATALKEVREEIGIELRPENGQLFRSFLCKNSGSTFVDVWLFHQNVNIDDVKLLPEETCDAMWASETKIRQMQKEGIFLSPPEFYLYLEDLMDFVRKS